MSPTADGLTDADGLPTLSVSPGRLIRCAQQVHWSLWVRLVGPALTSVQYGVLLVAGQWPGADERTIGERMSLDKSTTADVLRRLERRGLLWLRRSADDGRRQLVDLTDRGRDTLVGTASQVLEVQDRLLRPLSRREATELVGVLRTVAYRGDPPSLATAVEQDAAVEGWPAQLPPLRLHAAPGHLIRRAQQVHTLLWAEHVGSDLTSIQFNVLLVLHHRPGLDQRTLGELVFVDKSTGAELIGRMVDRGLIVRQRDLADGRRNVLESSATGSELLFRRAPAVVRVQRELLRWLPDRAARETFLSLLARIVDQQPGSGDDAAVATDAHL